jgi:translation initiation factor eIF-2B subunit delta
MAVSMGNAIRYIKWEITNLPPDLDDEEVRLAVGHCSARDR